MKYYFMESNFYLRMSNYIHKIQYNATIASWGSDM